MALTALAPERIAGLVAIDIALVDYHVRRHDEIFNAINAVIDAGAASRQQAATVMRQHLQEEGVIQFLLKSFVDGQWRFNVPVLWDQYPHIVGWQTVPAWPHPTLFIPEATRRTSPMNIAIPCSPSSHRRERTSSPAPATGCMRRNRKPSCAPFVAI